jgi:hypothetical protein
MPLWIKLREILIKTLLYLNASGKSKEILTNKNTEVFFDKKYKRKELPNKSDSIKKIR